MTDRAMSDEALTEAEWQALRERGSPYGTVMTSHRELRGMLDRVAELEGLLRAAERQLDRINTTAARELVARIRYALRSTETGVRK